MSGRLRLLPRSIEEAYARGDRAGSFDAAGLFADISGFTTMTEALMRHGKVGAEALASVLASVFDPLVDAIHAHGGEVVSFAGDAFTAVFASDAAGSGTGRALAAAMEVRDRMARSPDRQTPYGPFSFAIRMGLAAGGASWRIYEGAGGRHAYAFRGRAIEECAAAEHHAGIGDLVIPATLRERIATPMDVERIGDGSFLRVTGAELRDVADPVPAHPAPTGWLRPMPSSLPRWLTRAHAGSSAGS
ncbi:MAG: adenylate/guanylate cyclase domain-containing protein [Acidobacteriota bacterium]